MKQPEALRLANYLDMIVEKPMNGLIVSDASTELRRQFDLIKRLHEANQAMLEALKLIAETEWVDAALDPQRAVKVAQAAIAKAEGMNKGQQQT